MRYSLFLSVIFLVTVHWGQGQGVCGFDQSNKLLLNRFPQLRHQLELNELQLKQFQRRTKQQPSLRQQVYEIPVVIHILHTGDSIGSAYNPTDQQILDAIEYLNGVYSGSHPTMEPEGPDAAGDIGIRFVLAKRDPDCNPTNGIHRVDMSANAEYLSVGARHNDVDYDIALKSPVAWQPSQYYNIYVVNKINGKDGTSGQFIAGFAYFPSNSIVDGVVMLASQMKANSKTLAHEMGHAFNLYHPFEGSWRNDICPSPTNDEVDDTDPISYNANASGDVNFTCRTGANKCNNQLPYNIRTENNFMNYTNCFTLFTPGQKDRIRASLLLEERHSLINSTALLETYEGGEDACTPKVNFEADSLDITEVASELSDCRRYRDYTFYLTVGNAPTADAVATIFTDAGSEVKEGVDFEFVSGKKVTFPKGSRSRRSFKVRVYEAGERPVGKRLVLAFNLNSGGGNAEKGTAIPAMRLRLRPVDNRPVVPGAIKQIDIGRVDRKITDALMFDGYMSKQRTQILYKADELTARGMTAGKINGLSFLIGKKTNAPFKNFRIKAAGTSAQYLIRDGNFSSVPNTTELLTLPEYSTVSGWNYFAFDNPFYWNGTDNLCVELCFDNGDATSTRTDTLYMYADGSGNDIGNMMGAENAACNESFSSISYYSSGVKPVIRLSYEQPGNPVANASGTTASEYIGPYGEAFFYDNDSPRKLIASIKNLSNWNFGCVTFTIDRSGNNTSAFWNYVAENSVTDKTFYVTPEFPNPEGAYEITLYYTANQKRIYEEASRTPWSEIQLVKTRVPVQDISPDHPQMEKVEINPVVEHISFGEDVGLRARFNTGFSGYTAGVLTNAVLPVNWLGIEAKLENDVVVIGWKTGAEINNRDFVVELSTDGNHFVPLAQVAAAGNSIIENSYRFNHEFPLQGVLYYRIRQNDVDGKFSYSDIVQVNVTLRSNATLYPVPSNSYVIVNFGRNILNAGIEIISADGKLVYREKLQGLHSQRRIAVSSLAAGAYFVRIVEGNNIRIFRMVKN